MKKQTSNVKQKRERKESKTIRLNNLTIELEETMQGIYTYTFRKSLRTERELLPLVARVSGFADSAYTLDNDMIILSYYTCSNSVPFEEIEAETLHNQLHVLKNVGTLYESYRRGYTHILHPHNLYIDDNNLPYLLYRGYVEVMEPSVQTEADFVRQYQALVFSLFDIKYGFEELYNGALEIVKKTPFLEKIYSAQTVKEIQNIVDDAYHAERYYYEENHVVVKKNRYRTFQKVGISAIVIAFVLTAPLSWITLVKWPFDDRMSKATNAYIAERYDDVVFTLAKENPDSLPFSQLFMLAKSYLELESMSEQNKILAKKSLTYKSDVRIFIFWIVLGREDYRRALDIAKSINIDVYGYIATFKGVEIIKRSTGSGEQKEKDLKVYQAELKKYEEKLKQTTTKTT